MRQRSRGSSRSTVFNSTIVLPFLGLILRGFLGEAQCLRVIIALAPCLCHSAFTMGSSIRLLYLGFVGLVLCGIVLYSFSFIRFSNTLSHAEQHSLRHHKERFLEQEKPNHNPARNLSIASSIQAMEDRSSLLKNSTNKQRPSRRMGGTGRQFSLVDRFENKRAAKATDQQQQHYNVKRKKARQRSNGDAKNVEKEEKEKANDETAGGGENVLEETRVVVDANQTTRITSEQVDQGGRADNVIEEKANKMGDKAITANYTMSELNETSSTIETLLLPGLPLNASNVTVEATNASEKIQLSNSTANNENCTSPELDAFMTKEDVAWSATKKKQEEKNYTAAAAAADGIDRATNEESLKVTEPTNVDKGQPLWKRRPSNLSNWPHAKIQKKAKQQTPNEFPHEEQPENKQMFTVRDPLSHTPKKGSIKPLPFTPQVPYLGVLVDAGRQYYSIPWLKRLIRYLHYMNFNLIHFRLTDDQAFNIRLDSRPEFAKPSTVVHANATVYTPKELRELVAYAKARNVTIMPEINVPGHAGAWHGIPGMLVPCPNFICSKGYGIPLNIDHPQLLPILKDIIKEVSEIFDTSPFLHLGGDEVHMSMPCFIEAGIEMFDYNEFERNLALIVSEVGVKKAVRWEMTGQRAQMFALFHWSTTGLLEIMTQTKMERCTHSLHHKVSTLTATSRKMLSISTRKLESI